MEVANRKLDRKSTILLEHKYEFNAPKYYDFSKEDDKLK
jgi:hypothetical protein